MKGDLTMSTEKLKSILSNVDMGLYHERANSSVLFQCYFDESGNLCAIPKENVKHSIIPLQSKIKDITNFFKFDKHFKSSYLYEVIEHFFFQLFIHQSVAKLPSGINAFYYYINEYTNMINENLKNRDEILSSLKDFVITHHQVSMFDENKSGIFAIFFNLEGRLCEFKTSRINNDANLIQNDEAAMQQLSELFNANRSSALNRAKRFLSVSNIYNLNISDIDDLIIYGTSCAFRSISLNVFQKSLMQICPNEIITFVHEPYIERVPGNNNKSTFDFVKIDLSISTRLSIEEKKEYIKNNIKHIMDTAVYKISTSRIYTKFGVPINYLKVTSITLKQSSLLHIIFELKEIP